MECCMRRSDSILRKAAMRGLHLMKSSHAITDMELVHIGPKSMNRACNIITRVPRLFIDIRSFPVLRIRAGDHHFDDYLVRLRCGYRRVNYLGLRSGVHKCFLHVGNVVVNC